MNTEAICSAHLVVTQSGGDPVWLCHVVHGLVLYTHEGLAQEGLARLPFNFICMSFAFINIWFKNMQMCMYCMCACNANYCKGIRAPVAGNVMLGCLEMQQCDAYK